MAAGAPNIWMTDAFVPAKLVNERADLTICHGGQGTIQTAVSCGCPLIGFAMQPEQQINLDHIVQAGAGIRISAAGWKKKAIQKAIEKMAGDPAWKQNARKLCGEMRREDPRAKIAAAVWNEISQFGNPRSDRDEVAASRKTFGAKDLHAG